MLVLNCGHRVLRLPKSGGRAGILTRESRRLQVARSRGKAVKVQFYRHNIDEGDIANVASALRGEFLTTGDWVERFERDLAAFTGRRYAVGVSSGTAGLHLALAAAGIGPGDEVITTPMTFVATANAIVMAGARPVFVDVEEDTGNMRASLVSGAITGRTKAIVPVHLYGVMCDMPALRAVADKHGLVIVEDAAHALEARRDGVAPAELSLATMFSFYATKSITSGEGGAVVTGDAAFAERLRMMRLHGLSKSAAERHKGRYEHYDMNVFGWKYNMSNIQAALLLGQLPRVKEMRNRREAVAGMYSEGLAGVPGVRIPAVPEGCVSGRHLFTIWVDPARRDSVIGKLQANGVGVTVNYRPVHLMSYYRRTFEYKEGQFPVAERIGASTLSLPLYPKLKDEEVAYVVDAVRKAT